MTSSCNLQLSQCHCVIMPPRADIVTSRVVMTRIYDPVVPLPTPPPSKTNPCVSLHTPIECRLSPLLLPKQILVFHCTSPQNVAPPPSKTNHSVSLYTPTECPLLLLLNILFHNNNFAKENYRLARTRSER